MFYLLAVTILLVSMVSTNWMTADARSIHVFNEGEIDTNHENIGRIKHLRKRGSSELFRPTAEDTIQIELRINGSNVAFDLERNTNIPSDLPLYVAENGAITAVRSPANETLKAYINRVTGDSFLVTEKMVMGNKITQLKGLFHRNGHMFEVNPKKPIRKRARRAYSPDVAGDVSTISIDGTDHEIQQVDSNSLHYEKDTLLFRSRLKSDAAGSRLAFDVNGKQRYVVDYFAVIDYAVFARWYSFSSASTNSEKRQDALRNIRYYYTQIVNGVDSRYSSLNQDDFSINVRLIGYLVATTASDSPWTESSSIKIQYNGEAYVDIYKVLNAFRDYVKNNSMLTSADHVALFSGNILYDGSMGSNGPNVIEGLAWIASICTDERVSVSFEFGQYATIQSATHELGHNLGASHDGDDNQCSSRDQYVMATNPGSLTNSNFNNTFVFSPCSISAFRGNLASITTLGTNCLLVNSSQPTIDNEPNSTSPGQMYSVDQQCQHFYGLNSFYCAGGPNDQSICTRMMCWKPEVQECRAEIEQRAYDGTTCGNRMWCQRGMCIYDSNAPVANDTCIYGDFKGLVDLGGSAKTCSQIGSELPYKCYDPRIAADCCQTCSQIRRNNQTGCEFGDKDPSYCQQTSAIQCYDASFAATCCGTCATKRINLNIPNCDYGDRATWCPTLKPAKCSDNSETCCETCYTYKIGGQGTPSTISTPAASKKSSAASTISTPASSASFTPSPLPVALTASSTTSTIRSSVASSSSSTTSTPTTSTPSSTIRSSTSTSTTSTPSTTTSTPTTSKPSSTSSNILNSKTSTTSSSPPTSTTSLIPSTMKSSAASSPSSTTSGPHRMTAAPTCSGGDTASSDYCSRLTAEQCYYGQSVCCATCQKFYTGVSGCEYGDRASWCPNIYPGQCYDAQTESVCCAACSKLRKSDNGCEYGDRASWCANNIIFPGQCYDAESVCCATCSKFKTQKECRYGDKYSWCRKEYCSINGADCCATCST